MHLDLPYLNQTDKTQGQTLKLKNSLNNTHMEKPSAIYTYIYRWINHMSAFALTSQQRIVYVFIFIYTTQSLS